MSSNLHINAPAERWSAEQATVWAESKPWRCGFNYLPSSAVNFLDMWRGETFDPATIERELGWASEIGFNALRTNLHFLDWRHDADGLRGRIDRFLDIAAAARLSVMLCLFDDCEFSGEPAIWGSQPPPRNGVHNGRAIGSPGRSIVRDRARRGELRDYLQDVVSTFGADPRVAIWDLYNEPGNRMIFEPGAQRDHDLALEPDSLDLMRRSFEWARECAPSQPLTVAPWRLNPVVGDGAPSYWHPIDAEAIELSDVVSFHAYCSLDRLKRVTDELAATGRPLLCTEWLARPIGSRIEEQLPFFAERRIGAYQWGLVRGLSQTHLPWPGIGLDALPEDADPPVWFQDLLREDGEPHSDAEVKLISEAVRLAAA